MRGLLTLLLSRDGHLAPIAQFPKSKHGGKWCDFRQRNGNRYFDPSMFASRDDDLQRQFDSGYGARDKRREQQRYRTCGGENPGHHFNPEFWRRVFL